MASTILYPPIVDNQMKAFIGSQCDVYFSLSKFNSDDDFKSVQVTIHEQVTNKNYVNLHDDIDSGRYRATGVILNVIPERVLGEENLFKVSLSAADVSCDGGEHLGWEVGKIYKIQLRLSNAPLISESNIDQATWLNNHAKEFSEWSTVCIIKATAKIDYQIPGLQIDTTRDDQTSYDDLKTLFTSTLDIVGSFLRGKRYIEDPSKPDEKIAVEYDPSEFVKSYQFILYDDNDNIVEDSGTIFTENNDNDIDKIKYLFHTELKDTGIYRLEFRFESDHGYKDGFYKTKDESGEIDHRVLFQASFVEIKNINAKIATADNVYDLKRMVELDSESTHTHYGRYDHNFNSDNNIAFNSVIDVISPLESPSNEINGTPVKRIYSEKLDPVPEIDLPNPGEENVYYLLISTTNPVKKGKGDLYLGGWNYDVETHESVWRYEKQLTPPNDYSYIDGIRTVDEEEDEGRIGLKFYSSSILDDYSGNLCIRRTDSRSNFKKWEDIYIYVCIQKKINDIPMIYDYTVESGVFYKYAVQIIDRDGYRSVMNTSDIELQKPIIRNFNYSFLLGKNNKQLKLKFDNTMPNFKHQVIESKLDPINSTFPIVTRNASTNYRTFPINGLISFLMDDENTFTNKIEIYGNKTIAGEYQSYNTTHNISEQNDYIYEKDYRKKVLDFLYDGDFKLFKSPTEGNIIVRLMDINCVPIQSLDRMIYSFSATAYEMAEATMENLRKYGFYDPGTYATDFTTYETKRGQIQIDIPIGLDEKGNEQPKINILELIYDKYDSKGKNMGGYIKKLGDVYCLKITFDSKPMRVINHANYLKEPAENKKDPNVYTLGYNFSYNNKIFTVHSPNNIYEFDEEVHFAAKKDNGDSIFILGHEPENPPKSKPEIVSITVDFLYNLASETWLGHRIEQQQAKTNIGEFFQECAPGENIYNEIMFKYSIDWYTKTYTNFRKLNRLMSIEIEANPGTQLVIQDEEDIKNGEVFTIGDTCKLRFHELGNIRNIIYKGIQKANGETDTTVNQDIMIKYIAVIFEGTYKKETEG